MTPTQTFTKAVIWRIVAITITMSVVYLISGNIAAASGAGLVELLGKTFLYYFYDRLWNKLEEKRMNLYYTNTDPQKPHMVFYGRWCPLHKGHTWIIEKMRKEKDLPVLIQVRDTEFDEFDVETRAKLVKEWMIHNDIEGSICISCDIEGIYYGRGVGYNVEEIKPPDDIKVISATEIRKRISEEDDSWVDLVALGTEKILRDIIK